MLRSEWGGGDKNPGVEVMTTPRKSMGGGTKEAKIQGQIYEMMEILRGLALKQVLTSLGMKNVTCHYACSLCVFLASQLPFPANRNAELAFLPLFWPVNCIKIGGHVALPSGPTGYLLYCVPVL